MNEFNDDDGGNKTTNKPLNQHNVHHMIYQSVREIEDN